MKIFIDFQCEHCQTIQEDVEVDSEKIPKTKKCNICGNKMVRKWSSQISIPRSFKAVTPPFEDYMD